MITAARCLLVCVFGVLLAGCASQPIVRSAVSYWPFQRLEIQTSAAGIVAGYFSRPEVTAPQRLIVVLQAAPCVDKAAGAEAFNTSGILWEQFRSDSAFFQFERPGVRAETKATSTPSEVAPDYCKLVTHGQVTPELWTRTTRQAVAALRAGEGLSGLATMYIGVGEGALPAARLAAEDRHAAALVLVSGTGLNHRLDRLIAALRADERSLQSVNARVNEVLVKDSAQESRGHAESRSAFGSLSEPLQRVPGLPVLIVHGESDHEVPLESSLALFSELAVAGRPLSMLLFANLGRDFGLSERRYECFETAMRALGERARSLEHASPPRTANLETLACDSEDASPVSEALQIERIGQASR